VKDVVNGRYEVIRKLGAGGMASVYLAHDPLLGRDVAIKVPRLGESFSEGAAGDEDTLRRFQAELRAIGRLNHPNVVTIYDGGQDDGTPYLVMEPVEGENLAQLIRREAPLPTARAVDLAHQIADALSYAHQQGIVHRDVKPQNVLVERSGRAKVTDFGIAKSSDVTRTLTGTIMGTPSFMAPEVAAGEPVTAAADIYGLGVVLYQMLTGHVPFESDNAIAAAIRSQREDPRPPSSLAPVPAWLDAVVLRAIAREPHRRYRSAADLAADLAAGRAPGPPATGPRAWSEGARGRERRVGARREEHERTLSFVREAPATPRSKQESGSQPRRRPRVLWLLPVAVVAAIGIALAVVATHAPGQTGPASKAPTASPKVPPPSGSPNLLSNGALVTNGPQPAGWQLQVFGGGEPVRNWRPAGAANGDREITLESASGTDSAWISNEIKVEPGWKLTLTGFIQTRGVPADGPGAALWIVCQGADGKQTGQAISQAVHGNTGWGQVQAQGTAPAGTANCNAQLRLGAPGKNTTGIAEFSRISLAAG
jgi:serine/threonine protein kinase